MPGPAPAATSASSLLRGWRAWSLKCVRGRETARTSCESSTGSEPCGVLGTTEPRGSGGDAVAGVESTITTSGCTLISSDSSSDSSASAAAAVVVGGGSVGVDPKGNACDGKQRAAGEGDQGAGAAGQGCTDAALGGRHGARSGGEGAGAAEMCDGDKRKLPATPGRARRCPVAVPPPPPSSPPPLQREEGKQVRGRAAHSPSALGTPDFMAPPKP